MLDIVKQIANQKCTLSINGTYKLNDKGYPTIVVVITDLNRQFHLSKISINLI